MTTTADLLIRAGRIVCPATRLDAPGAVVIRGDRIIAVGPDVDAPCRQRMDEPDAILLPGLIDLHGHPARSGSRFGIDPDSRFLQRGTTTVLSQGDAGAETCRDYVLETIEPSRTRIRLALNLSSRGESGPGGCCEDPARLDVAACISAVERHRPHLWGISVNASHHACGQTDPREVLRRGRAVAEAAGLPLLYGLRRPEDWPLEEQLQELRPGDVVTYCYRRTPHCIVSNGRVIDAVLAARKRGIRFDVGHGLQSFDFDTAETALRQGFAPDTISTDLQRGHIGQSPIHDLPLVMSKLRAAGMTEQDIFRAVTVRPAQLLGLDGEIGVLSPGHCADLVLLRWDDRASPLRDAHGNVRHGGQWTCAAAIRAGRLAIVF